MLLIPREGVGGASAPEGARPRADRQRARRPRRWRRASPAAPRRSRPSLRDQRVIAGLGNIYVCEALWRAGCRRAAPPARWCAPTASRRSAWSGWSRRSAPSSPTRSRRAARRCATTCRRTASSGSSSTASPSMTARASRARRLPRHHPPHRAVRPLDLLLPGLPALRWLQIRMRPSSSGYALAPEKVWAASSNLLMLRCSAERPRAQADSLFGEHDGLRKHPGRDARQGAG